ncbi:uncharacterized protein LOC111311531 isoform X3 [Durio zibethinus]|uniref:Uncharacterized protein LOC111311531 isoform X3 n=1 Tax=Durio zibethinus TaxID=66656 RepID=A0A6P6APA6_DURZI|nr:uncharacterized protein LOC111311531 isoform X3 [Durio zibethinus]
MERREAQEQQQQLIWKSEPESMVSVTIGRAMTTLLTARPKKLHHSISCLSPDSSNKPSLATLDESLWFLHKYVTDASQRDGTLDEILVPMIQHSLKYKDSKHDSQPMILLSWLFQDELLFQAVAMNLANIIMRKDDRFIAFGWCILVRGLMECESTTDQNLVNGIKEKYNALLKILCTSIPHLLCIVRKGSGAEKAAPCMLKDWSKCLSGCRRFKCIMVAFKMRQAGSKILKTRALLLSSCWKHYGMLLHLEDKKFTQQYKELLEQYLSGIQYYTNNYDEGHAESKDGGIETRKFFLNCLCLMLGRFDGKKFEGIVLDYGNQISHVLLSQLHCNDEDVIEGVVCIFKAVIFKTNNSSGSSLTDTNQMDAVVPLLLHLLDERDAAARAVVILMAEYCSLSADGHCLEEVLKRLASGNAIQRRNAFDVISELIHISKDSPHKAYHSTQQVIANHLLVCLEDEETAIREQTPNLLPLIDPSYVLPALVHLVCSSDEKVQPAASEAFIRVLKHHNQKPEVMCMLLDNLSNLSQCLTDAEAGACIGKGSNLDRDRVLRLIPEWSKTVQDWNALIGALLDKMFAEPSNATIVRFLSHINEQLAEAADLVLCRVLLQMKGQKGIDEDFFSRWETRTCTSDDSMRMQQSLFERLCPLLIIRLLPLRVFNNLNSSVMYGHLHNLSVMHEYRDVSGIDDNSVVAFLVNSAFSKFEFEDVRKLAAELCGRIHPQVLLPLVCSQLEHAADSQDILKIKACLFSVCTSLVVRGMESLLHPFILQIWRTIEVILLWPTSDGDEVSKAQHGCIDCLALILCGELQAPESFKDCTSWRSYIVGKKGNSGNATSKLYALRYVIHQLINDKSEHNPGSKLRDENCEPIPVSFRLCLANVLISACQKISDYGKKPLAKTILPCLIDSVEVIMQPEIRAACIQVLFSAVYHLKSAVLPYSCDLFKLSLKFLGNGSEKERMAGAKLMASLMASEDSILETISGGLLEARSLLSDISMTDPSFDIQQVCKKLLACITSA